MNKLTLFRSITAVFIITNLFFGTQALAGSVAESILKSRHLLADKGNVDAQYKLGSMYELGIGTERNLAMATDFYTKASSSGNTNAKNRLHYLKVKKNGFNQKNDSDWLNKIKKEANKGDSQAAMLLGQMHSYGLGVKKDLNTSIAMLNRSNLNNPIILYEIDRVENERKQLAITKQELIQQRKADLAAKKIIDEQDKTIAKAMKKEAEAKRIADKKRRYAEYQRKLVEEERLIEEQQVWAEQKAPKKTKPIPKAKLAEKQKLKSNSRYAEIMQKLQEEERILNQQQAWAETK